MKIFASTIAALMMFVAAGCAFGDTSSYARSEPLWNAMLAVLAEEAKSTTLAYHNPQHDPARVEQMRARVIAARIGLEQRVQDLRRDIRGQAYDQTIVQRQLTVLDRYDALARLTERVRLAAIAGDMDQRRKAQIINFALFGEVDWTLAEQLEAAPLGDAEPLMRAIAADWRAQALNSFARRDVLLGDAAGVASAQQELIRVAATFRDLAQQAEAPRARPYLDAMTAEERARAVAYLDAAPTKMLEHAEAVESLARALATTTPETVDALQWESFVQRYPPPESAALR